MKAEKRQWNNGNNGDCYGSAVTETVPADKRTTGRAKAGTQAMKNMRYETILI